MVDAVTRRRWEREDERDRWREYRRCPACSYPVHPDTNVRGDDDLTCPNCYCVFPIKESA